jgi:glycosyltransferase 2 family protein
MLLVGMTPIAIGGWGVREAVVVVLLRSVQIAAEPALLLSLSYGAVLTISALPGIAAWLGLAGARRGPDQK